MKVVGAGPHSSNGVNGLGLRSLQANKQYGITRRLMRNTARKLRQNKLDTSECEIKFPWLPLAADWGRCIERKGVSEPLG